MLSSQSLADESIVHEDCLYPISELAHWPHVMTSATELLFPCLCPPLLSPVPSQTRHTVCSLCFAFRCWTRFVVMYIFVLHPPREADCLQILHSANLVSSPTTKCSQIGNFFLDFASAMTVQPVVHNLHKVCNVHAHKQYLLISHWNADSDTVKLLIIATLVTTDC